MKIEYPSTSFMFTVFVVSMVVHGLLTVTFATGAVALLVAFASAGTTGSLVYSVFLAAAIPMLLSGYVRAGDFASAEIARLMVWLFYGEWVPR